MILNSSDSREPQKITLIVHTLITRNITMYFDMEKLARPWFGPILTLVCAKKTKKNELITNEAGTRSTFIIRTAV